jgi:branched-chain amino acid transport system substrate-binding protein
VKILTIVNEIPKKSDKILQPFCFRDFNNFSLQPEPGFGYFYCHPFGNLKNLELAGKAAEGVLLPLARVNVGDLLPDNQPQKKVILEYKKAHEARFKEPVSSFGGHARDAMYLAISALR